MPYPARTKDGSYPVGTCCFIGILGKVVFRDMKSSFIIAKCKSRYGKTELIVKGPLTNPRPDSKYHFEGHWNYNKERVNWEFLFNCVEPGFDSSEEGIVAYLKSEVPHLGEKKARELYAKYGKQTLDILEKEPERIALEILGLTWAYTNEIAEFLKKQSGAKAIKEKLYAIGISAWSVNAIFTEFGVNAESIIRQDCFSLTKIRGLGFIKVSQIADLVGVPADDPSRIKAAIMYAITELMSEGHTCLYGHEIICKAQELLGQRHVKITDVLQKLVDNKELATENSDPKEFITDSSVFDDMSQLDEMLDKVFTA